MYSKQDPMSVDNLRSDSQCQLLVLLCHTRVGKFGDLSNQVCTALGRATTDSNTVAVLRLDSSDKLTLN